MEYRLFLDSAELREPVRTLLTVFENHSARLTEDAVKEIPDVLNVLRTDLESLGWTCSVGRRSRSGVSLATPSGRPIRADAWHPTGTALWLETGRSWTNFAFLQHAVEAALAPQVENAVVAVRQSYKGQSTFDNCAAFLDELFSSERLRFPYRTLALLGY